MDTKICCWCFYPPVDPPQITQDLTLQLDVVPGSTAKFTITATGGGDLTYKWQRNGADLDPLPEGVSGETTTTLQIHKVKKSHEGAYTCIVSNKGGDTTSNPAQLTVCKCLYLAFFYILKISFVLAIRMG